MRASYSVLAARVASLLIVVAAEGASSSILTESSGAEEAAAAPILDPGGCGLYLAESSIPGGGMGMYLGERSLALRNVWVPWTYATISPDPPLPSEPSSRTTSGTPHPWVPTGA